MDRLLSRFFDSEVSGLAPWIAAHLGVLADPLGLHDLHLERRESPVGTFRLDLLARGTRSGGDEVAVAIEVQLGSADHDHLGKLVTYLAHEGSGVGVWVVDRATHPHLRAVDFLNRSTGDHLAWWLVTFEQDGGTDPDVQRTRVVVHAGPGVPLPPPPPRPVAAGAVRSHPTRTEFLQDVLAAVSQPSVEQGWGRPRITNKGYAITWRLPASSPLQRTEIKLRCHADEIVLHLLVRGYGAEGNERAIAAARRHHEEAIAAMLPTGAELRWHRGHRDADSVHIAVPGASWEGDAHTAPEAVLACLEALREPVLDRRLHVEGTNAP